MTDKMRTDWEAEQLNEQIKRMKDIGIINAGEISDGYHTFDELYHHRTVLFATICNMHHNYYNAWISDTIPVAWKSKLHADGTMYDGMFIAGFETHEGSYTYHCDMKYWDMFDNEEIPNAPKWDGHKPEDVTRMLSVDI